MRRLLHKYYDWRIKRLEDSMLFTRGLTNCSGEKLIRMGNISYMRDSAKLAYFKAYKATI